jgi:hypothetical protein
MSDIIDEISDSLYKRWFFNKALGDTRRVEKAAMRTAAETGELLQWVSKRLEAQDQMAAGALMVDPPPPADSLYLSEMRKEAVDTIIAATHAALELFGTEDDVRHAIRAKMMGDELTRGGFHRGVALRVLPGRVRSIPPAVLSVPAFSQRDDRWCNDPIGIWPGHGKTIGSHGCLVTSMASVVSSAIGRECTPEELAHYLQHDVVGFSDDLMVLDCFEQIAHLKLLSYLDCRYTPAPVEKIGESLARGEYVIVKVDFHPGGEIQEHWCRLLSTAIRDGGLEDALLMDPWPLPGQNIVWLSEHYATGTDMSDKRWILAVLTYGREGARIVSTRPPTARLMKYKGG